MLTIELIEDLEISALTLQGKATKVIEECRKARQTLLGGADLPAAPKGKKSRLMRERVNKRLSRLMKSPVATGLK